jgi:hypothetical protein
MIIELNKENLQKCGFENEDIKRLIEWDNYSLFLICDTCHYATNTEKKIYTEIDGYRKYYFENGAISFPMDCPDLIPNYFDLALKYYLDKQILLLNTMFVEADQKKKFVLNEIEKIKSRIEVIEQDLKLKENLNNKNKLQQIDIYDSYRNFLKIKLNKLHQQIETNKLDEVKNEPKKLAEKWFALLYWIELNVNGKQPPKNSEGAFIKSEIEAIRKKITGKSGQSFYRAFINIDLNNEKSIKVSFGKEWQKKIIELSEKNPKIIDYIQSKYSS